MSTYKMKTTQKGVLAGAIHPATFEQGKTYELDDDLAGEFQKLDAVEPSSEEAVAPIASDTANDTHENWLDTDPAVLRHGELTAAQVIARDESPFSEGQTAADQVEGKAEGDQAPGPAVAAPGDEAEGKSRKSK